MNRILHIFNLLGVIVLAGVCIYQWRINREVNLEANRLEKLRIEHTAKIEEQEKTIAGYVAELDFVLLHR